MIAGTTIGTDTGNSAAEIKFVCTFSAPYLARSPWQAAGLFVGPLGK